MHLLSVYCLERSRAECPSRCFTASYQLCVVSLKTWLKHSWAGKEALAGTAHGGWLSRQTSAGHK